MPLLLPGAPGWCEELDAEVLRRLNVHDLRALRLARRLGHTVASKFIRSMLISYSDFYEVQLERNLPHVRRMVLLKEARDSGLLLLRFALENSAALRQLRELDISAEAATEASALFGAISAANLPLLRLIKARLTVDVRPCAWRALARLPALTRLDLVVDGEWDDEDFQGLASGAPQLEELRLVSASRPGWSQPAGSDYAADISALAALPRLRSLSLDVGLFGDSDTRALSSMTGLTFLSLVTWDSDADVDGCLYAAAQLWRLRELHLGFKDHSPLPAVFEGWDFWPLSQLKQLTRIGVSEQYLSTDFAECLTALPALRSLSGGAIISHAALLEGLQLLQLETLEVTRLVMSNPADDVAPPQPYRVPELYLSIVSQIRSLGGWFDWAALRKLAVDVPGRWPVMGHVLIHALGCCTQLASLSVVLKDSAALTVPLLAAVAALPRLRQLRLQQEAPASPASLGVGQIQQPFMLVGCRQLQQLTLVRLGPVEEELVLSLLMVLSELRALRLLQCGGAPSQARCQALLLQRQRYDARIDVVPNDGSTRSGWLSEELAKRWDEALDG